ncbi:MAG: hypothetical protein QXP10_01460 [Sulfolobales archaeon]
MRTIGAVVLAGELRYSEVPPPPAREDEALVKVLSAALTPLDVAAVRGYAPYAYGKVVGSAGLVRVLDLGYRVTNLVVGESAVVSPKCFIKLALVKNGVMADQASIESSCLEPAPQSLTSSLGLYTSLLAHLPLVVSSLSGSSVLVAGCGYEAVALIKLIKDEVKTEAICVSEFGLRRISRLGVRAYLRDRVGGEFDVVYVSSLDPYVNNLAISKCMDSLYISPLVPEYFVTIGSNLKKVMVLSRAKPNIAEALSIARKVGSEVGNMFKAVDNLKAVVESVKYHTHIAYVPPSDSDKTQFGQR